MTKTAFLSKQCKSQGLSVIFPVNLQADVDFVIIGLGSFFFISLRMLKHDEHFPDGMHNSRACKDKYRGRKRCALCNYIRCFPGAFGSAR